MMTVKAAVTEILSALRDAGNHTIMCRTVELSGQHIIIAGTALPPALGRFSKPVLYLVEQLLRDDRRAFHTSLKVAEPVLAHVIGAVQQTGQRACVPLVSGGIPHTQTVQPDLNILQTLTGSITLEDALCDRCGRLVDDKMMVDVLVSERNVRRQKPSLPEAFLTTTAGLTGKLGAVVFVHALQNGFHDDALRTVRDLLRCRHNTDTVVPELPLIHGTVKAVPGKTVELVNKDRIEHALFAVVDHALKLLAVGIGAALGAVDVLSDDLHVIVGGELLTDVELPFNGLLGLVGTAVPPIKGCTFHIKIPP